MVLTHANSYHDIGFVLIMHPSSLTYVLIDSIVHSRSDKLDVSSTSMKTNLTNASTTGAVL